MGRRKKIPDEPVKEVYPIFQLWVILACGIAISLIGVYLKVSNQLAFGPGFPGKSGGTMQGTQVVYPMFCIGFGIVFSIFPAYFIIKQKIRKANK